MCHSVNSERLAEGSPHLVFKKARITDSHAGDVRILDYRSKVVGYTITLEEVRSRGCAVPTCAVETCRWCGEDLSSSWARAGTLSSLQAWKPAHRGYPWGTLPCPFDGCVQAPPP